MDFIPIYLQVQGQVKIIERRKCMVEIGIYSLQVEREIIGKADVGDC